ncbi:lytic polysaccharide monooxygenase [Atractiella rhizophila]|nr:lytic polysaccharide monooxygenase [Atractiella rhizophila]
MMLSTLVSACLPLAAIAHYTWPRLNSDTADWQVVRMTDNHYSRAPVENVADPNLRLASCYTGAGGTASSATPYPITAGSNVTFWTDDNLYHPGVVNVYMAKASGSSVTTWDGSGTVWFKELIDAKVSSQSAVAGLQALNFKIPAATPTGQYLLRAEHIALHSAGILLIQGCAQIQVNNGGSGSPGPLVAIPGAYSATLTINIWWPIPTSYVQPGPAVWTG